MSRDGVFATTQEHHDFTQTTKIKPAVLGQNVLHYFIFLIK